MEEEYRGQATSVPEEEARGAESCRSREVIIVQLHVLSDKHISHNSFYVPAKLKVLFFCDWKLATKFILINEDDDVIFECSFSAIFLVCVIF